MPPTNDIKSKPDNFPDKSTYFILGFGYLIGITLVVLAWVYFRDPSTCSNSAIISLQNWLLGFAVSGTFTAVCVGLAFIFLRNSQLDLGSILYVVIAVIFALFFFIYHWFAYDALFSRGLSCMTAAPGLWISTLVIIVIQLASIPCSFLLIALYRMLSNIAESIPGKKAVV